MPPLDSEAPASETAPAPVSFVEVNDAGEQIDQAFSITTDLIQPLTYISGALSGDADIFQIYISGDQPFSATTLSRETLLDLPIDNELGIPNSLLGDPQLFLFDAQGNGIYGNDDLYGSSQATLPSGPALLTPGIYYLAVSSFDYDPISAAGEIFPDDSQSGVLFPTGPGGGSPLVGFAGEVDTSGDYVISLTGAQTVQPTVQPTVPLAELVDLTGSDGNVTLNVTLTREAAFDNVLVFYETDALGRVGGLLPGDAGYEAAAAANLVDGVALMIGNNQTADLSLTLAGGTYYAPALLIDGSTQNLATVGDAASGQARIIRQDNTFLFEDLVDFDFNDLVVTFTA